MSPRAFISFEMEDRWARDFLVHYAKEERNDIDFVDYSVQEPWNTSWKTQCRERIGRTRGTIVLIGKTTYQSDAVKWEIAETMRQGHPIFGIQIISDQTQIIPVGLQSQNVIRGDFGQIAHRLSTWS